MLEKYIGKKVSIVSSKTNRITLLSVHDNDITLISLDKVITVSVF